MKLFREFSEPYFIQKRQYSINKNMRPVISRLYRRKTPILSSEIEAELFFRTQSMQSMVMQNLCQKRVHKVQSKLIPNYTLKKVVIHEED